MLSKMNGNQWVAVECLLGLVAFGISSFFWKPTDSAVLMIVITAIVSALNNALGVQSGSHLPEQAGDAKPGQASHTETTSRTTTQAPPEIPTQAAAEPPVELK